MQRSIQVVFLGLATDQGLGSRVKVLRGFQGLGFQGVRFSVLRV